MSMASIFPCCAECPATTSGKSHHDCVIPPPGHACYITVLQLISFTVSRHWNTAQLLILGGAQSSAQAPHGRPPVAFSDGGGVLVILWALSPPFSFTACVAVILDVFIQ